MHKSLGTRLGRYLYIATTVTVKLIDLGVCTFQDGQTALIKASISNHTNIVRRLIAIGANLDIQNEVTLSLQSSQLKQICIG